MTAATRLRLLAVSLTLLGFTAACKSKTAIDTGIIVEVTSDLVVPGEMNKVQVIGTDPQGNELYLHTFELGTGANRVSLPLLVGLHPLNDTNTPLHVKAVGLSGGTTVVTRSATLSFFPGKKVRLSLPLLAVCKPANCLLAYTTCKENGQCEDDHEDSTKLPTYESGRKIPGQDAGATRPDAEQPDAPEDDGKADSGLTSDASSSTGGKSGTTAGSTATGGSTSPVGGAGGTSSAGGATPSGGTSAVGGTGGNASFTGGTSSAGGETSSPGGAAGSSSLKGGTTSVGRTLSTVAGAGGSSSSTGGSGGQTPTGGTGGGGTSGGSTEGTGGSSATGGTSAGGSSAGTTASQEPVVYISTDGSCVSGSGTTWTPGSISTSTGTSTVTIDGSVLRQSWEGFGGAFNEWGWYYLQTLSAAERARVMQLLFGADGAHLSLGRIPMGANDYATERYTDDEGGVDVSMANFNITQDLKYIIPYIKAALAENPDIRFWASPWTPPTWMKTGPFTATSDDGATTQSNFDSGNMADDATSLAAYAKYFVKFIDAYKQENINISMVAPQNDPHYAMHYPSCIWTSSVFAKFVGQHLGPELQGTGVGIMLGALSNTDSGMDLDLADAVLADPTAKPFFKVAGVQWSVLDKVNLGTSFADLRVWATEHKGGNYPWQPNGFPQYNATQAPNDQAYGVESWGYIRDAINKGRVTAYHAWNMVLDTVGNGIDTHRQWNQNALLAINASTKAVKVTPAYCVFRHFSQFVEPGATVVAASGGDTVAFKNPDGTLVAVMFNSGATNNEYVVSMGSKKYQFTMPTNAWATVKVKP